MAQKLTQGLENELSQIKRDFAEKQKSIQEYEALKALISDEASTKKLPNLTQEEHYLFFLFLIPMMDSILNEYIRII